MKYLVPMVVFALSVSACGFSDRWNPTSDLSLTQGESRDRGTNYTGNDSNAFKDESDLDRNELSEVCKIERRVRKQTIQSGEAESRLIQFMSGKGGDQYDRTAKVIADYDFGQLEACHHFIQWIFPTLGKSGSNSEAPRLTKKTIQRFRDDAEIRKTIQRSFATMLDFYGYELIQSGSGPSPRAEHLKKTKHHAERTRNWAVENTHNHLRISRMIDSLRLLKFDGEATALYEVARRGRKRFPRSISDKTYVFWKEKYEQNVDKIVANLPD